MTVLWSDSISEIPEIVTTAAVEFNTLVTTFENKAKQYASKSDTPIQSWVLKWGTISEANLNAIYQFYIARLGKYEAFYWDHPYEVTTLTQAASTDTVLHVAQVMRVLVGDTLRIGGSSYTVAAVSVSAKTITITGAITAALGDSVQLRYTVRFAADLTYDTMKAWLYTLGLPFERNIA